jgi:hypothetical protein
MKPSPVFSQRYLRKGPLVEETYRLFSGWNYDKTASENFDLAFLARFPTIASEREVRAPTLSAGYPVCCLRDWRCSSSSTECDRRRCLRRPDQRPRSRCVSHGLQEIRTTAFPASGVSIVEAASAGRP